MNDTIWTTALHELEGSMTRATFDTWLRDSKAVAYHDEHTLTVAVNNTYAVEWLQSRL